MSIHKQARAEAERIFPKRSEHTAWIDSQRRIAYERGYRSGHEAATRTREWSSIDPPPGWFTFGTHVEHDGPLEFSEDVGDDLMPLWERPATHPRVVTTVTELDALPVGSVVRNANGVAFVKTWFDDGGGLQMDRWHATGFEGRWVSEAVIGGGITSPARVLYEPEETRMSPINATPPTPADYERTIAQHREYIEQLEARVRQAEEALRDVPCEHQRAGYLRMQAERDEWHKAALTATAGESRAERERDEARGKLDKVRRLIPTENPELIEAGYGIDAGDLLAILDGKTGD